MVFSSEIFLFVFLPAVLAVYFSVRGAALRNVGLVVASMIFYSWGEGRYGDRDCPVSATRQPEGKLHHRQTMRWLVRVQQLHWTATSHGSITSRMEWL
jgi:hypothetical protein